ncbi:nucleotidyltransferase [Streptomyces nogalater]
MNHLRERLEDYIATHPDFDLVKLRASGSTAKHTAIRRRSGTGSDADVAAYLRTTDTDIDVSTMLTWLRDRCIEVYGATKDADDFKPSDHAVGITMRSSGLKIDVVPVLYTGEPDDRGTWSPPTVPRCSLRSLCTCSSSRRARTRPATATGS